MVRIEARIVGLVEFSNAVVQDDIDRPQGYLLLTPALTRVLLAAHTSGGITQYGLQLDDGARDVAVVEREIDSQLGNGGQAQFHVAAVNEAQAQSAIEPDWIALAAFAVIAGLATLVIAAQAIAREVRAGSDDMRVLRALGAGPAMAAADCLLGILGAVVAGSLLAAAVAVALSPVAPIGPVRPVYPSSGVAFGWTVLGFGFLALAGSLAAVAVAVAFRAASQHGAGPATLAVARGSGAGRLAATSGLPAPAVAGVHFAFDPGKGRTTVAARSAISGTVIAVVMVVATLTFGSSLSTLVSHPSLYGWNWTYALSVRQGPAAIPPRQVGSRLRGDPDVAAWTRISFATAELTGRPSLCCSPRRMPRSASILSGHQVSGRDQIVLGPGHPRADPPAPGRHRDVQAQRQAVSIHTRLAIVGTATMPTVGISQGMHTSMGTGALVSNQILGPLAVGLPARPAWPSSGCATG